MNRNLAILAAFAGAGVLLAALLIRVPDTGGDVPDVDLSAPVPRAQADAREEVRKAEPQPLNGREALRQKLPDVPRAKINDAIRERRSQPDAVYLGRAAGSITYVRRALASNPAASELVAESSDLVRALRDARRDADNADVDALDAKIDALRAKIEASPFYNEEARQAFDQLDQHRGAFTTAD